MGQSVMSLSFLTLQAPFAREQMCPLACPLLQPCSAADGSRRQGCTQAVHLLIHMVSTAQVGLGFSLQRAPYTQTREAPCGTGDAAGAAAQAPCRGSLPHAGRRGKEAEPGPPAPAPSGSKADAVGREMGPESALSGREASPPLLVGTAVPSHAFSWGILWILVRRLSAAGVTDGAHTMLSSCSLMPA